MGEREDDLGRRYNQEAGMAYNIHGLSHADYQRLLRIEAAARELIERHDDLFPSTDGQQGDDVEALRASLAPPSERDGRGESNECSCCNGTRVGPPNSNFAGQPCLVCR